MADYDAVIIGGGLGGLLCANILSKEGMNICLIEKNHKLGGSMQTFGRKGCIFNTGLNYTESLDDGQVLNRYFRYFGLQQKLNLRRLDESGFEVINFNNAQYKFAMGRELYVETLVKDFPPKEKDSGSMCEKLMKSAWPFPCIPFPMIIQMSLTITT